MFEIEPYEKEIATKAIKHYGEKAQTIKAIEEMAELQKELAKCINGQGERDKITEEFADVYYMLYQLAEIYHLPPSEIREWIEIKSERLNNRICKDCEMV